MARAGIALGSNLGDRRANLHRAIASLTALATPGEAILEAPVYQTEPRFCPAGSPDFLNTVIEIGFGGTARELLVKTRAIERRLGRVRGAEQNAPRTIDIDLLYLGDERSHDETLELPHPRIGERRFVLQPLADIRPDLVLPGNNLTVADLLDALQTDEAPLIPVAESGRC